MKKATTAILFIQSLYACCRTKLSIVLSLPKMVMFAFCHGYPSPIPFTCVGCTSLTKIYFLWFLHFPPLCVLLTMLLWLQEDGFFSSIFLAWYQRMIVVFQNLSLLPSDFSMAEFFQSVAFADWIPIPGRNKLHGAHVAFEHRAIFAHLQSEIVGLMLLWCPNLITIRSHGRFPNICHKFILHLKIITTGKSDNRKHTHPQALGMGHRTVVRVVERKRNVQSLLKDALQWYGLETGQDMSTAIMAASDELDYEMLERIYVETNKLYYQDLGRRCGTINMPLMQAANVQFFWN